MNAMVCERSNDITECKVNGIESWQVNEFVY